MSIYLIFGILFFAGEFLWLAVRDLYVRICRVATDGGASVWPRVAPSRASLDSPSAQGTISSDDPWTIFLVQEDAVDAGSVDQTGAVMIRI